MLSSTNNIIQSPPRQDSSPDMRCLIGDMSPPQPFEKSRDKPVVLLEAESQDFEEDYESYVQEEEIEILEMEVSVLIST